MEILLLFFGIVALVWVAVLCRYGSTKLSLFHPIPVLGMLIVLTGSVISRDFWSIGLGPLPLTIDRMLLVVLIGVYLFRYLLHREDRRQINRMDIALISLMFVLTISTVTHDMTTLDNMPPSRLLFFNLMPLALYGVMRTGVLGINDLKLISVGLIGLAIYLALTAIAETRGWTGLVFPRYIMTSEMKEFLGRGRGPFLNPVSNGYFMIVGFCAATMWWKGSGRWRKVAIGAVSLLLFIGVYSTYTRSVWLGLVVATGWFVWIPASRQAKGVMLVLAMLAVIALMPVIGDKILSFKRDKEVTQNQMEKSAQLRPLFAIVAMNMFQDRPFLGCGFGQYAKAKYPYLQDHHSGKPLSSTKTLMQHNIFLAYLTETGLVGLLSLLFALGMMGRAAMVVWMNYELPYWPRQFGLLLLAFLTCHVVNGMFHDVSIIPMANMLLFFLAGIANNLVSGQWQFSPQRTAVHDDWQGRTAEWSV